MAIGLGGFVVWEDGVSLGWRKEKGILLVDKISPGGGKEKTPQTNNESKINKKRQRKSMTSPANRKREPKKGLLT